MVPWDLSEVDRDGRVIAGGGDDNAGAIGLVLLFTVVVAFAMALFGRQGARATSFALGGCLMWAFLIGWRVGTARTSGANMFLVPFVVVVVPTIAIAPALVAAVAGWAQRHRDRQGA
jgi:hypothetical protein